MISLKQLLEVCKRLNENCVEYAVIGGWAIFLHGYERATRDIDIIVKDSDDNIAKLKEALKDLLPEACAELQLDDIRENAVVRMAGEDLIVDLIKNVGEIDFECMAGHMQNETIENINVPIADTQTMLELKRGVRNIDKRDYLFLKGKLDYMKKRRNK